MFRNLKTCHAVVKRDSYTFELNFMTLQGLRHSSSFYGLRSNNYKATARNSSWAANLDKKLPLPVMYAEDSLLYSQELATGP
jgi:hypothetical protein